MVASGTLSDATPCWTERAAVEQGPEEELGRGLTWTYRA